MEITGPQTDLFVQRIGEMKDEEGKVIEVAPHPQQIVRFKVDRA